MIKQKWRIPPTQGLGFKLEKGQVVRITDVKGEQIADFVAYRADDTSVRLDPGVTMDVLRAMKIKPGDLLYSNTYSPLLTVVADTVGQHDFINSPCRSEMYELLYDKQNHESSPCSVQHSSTGSTLFFELLYEHDYSTFWTNQDRKAAIQSWRLCRASCRNGPIRGGICLSVFRKRL
jgi:hypothetical protein